MINMNTRKEFGALTLGEVQQEDPKHFLSD
jgi:hypothetical protein